MLTMAIIYIAGVISGVLLIAIALAGWIRQSGKLIRGGDANQTPGRHRRTRGNTNAGAASMARHRPDYDSRVNSATPRVA